jgi:alpha-L-rhamnosidase
MNANPIQPVLRATMLPLLLAGAMMTHPAAFAAPPADKGLSEEAFRDPPLAARPSALWSWLNGYVDHAQITRELEEMKAKGMRGAIIWDVGAIADPDKLIPVGPSFLGPESLNAIHHVMNECARLGLETGLFASSSWNAGGSWITPPDSGKELRWSETKVSGPSEFSEILPMPDKARDPYEEVAVLALPQAKGRTIEKPTASIRLDDRLAADGKLTWSVPAGEWSILRFVANRSGEHLKIPSPKSDGLLVDHLSSRAMEVHFNHILDTIGRGRDGFGPLKVLMLDSYEVKPTVDWTNGFQQEFEKRNGYDPKPWLPVLAGWTVGDGDLANRFRHDYKKLVSDLLIENHFARGCELLHQRGLQLLAEAGHGGHPRVDPLKALGAADIPMGEFWNQNKNWVTKEAASAAHIYGHRLVNAETLTGWRNWQDGPAAYKRLYDLAFCAGLNQASFHTFAHNPPDAGKPGFAYHAGEHFNVNSTWWPYAKPMIEDMSRSCHMLQQGQFVADVCAYYGDDAPNLVPARRIPPGVPVRWPDEMCPHCGMKKPVDLDSLGQGYDYDYINEDVILNRLRVKDGRLVLPDGMNYRVMVLPDRESISPEALRRVGEFIEAGATVAGRKPLRSNSLRGYPDCDREVRELADRIWGPCDGETVRSHTHGAGKVFWNVPLNEVLANMGVTPDFTVESPSNEQKEIDYIHRRTQTEDIYFVANTSTGHRSAVCRFRVTSGRVPSFWHPDDGSARPCPVYQTGDGFIRLTVDLAPSNSLFVVFREEKSGDHLTSVSSPSTENTAIEVLGFEKNAVSARVWQPGEWRIESAKGLKGGIAVREVPADQPVTGPWQVGFPEKHGAPSGIVMETLTDWTAHTDPGVRHFSGTARYHTSFTLSTAHCETGKQVILDLGEVKEVAEVTVNGRNLGIAWKQPNRIDITPAIRAGENQLEIAVANLWNNRIVGDLKNPDLPPVANTNIKNKFNAKSPLLPSGLLGPVTLRFPVTVTTRIQL